MAANDYRFHSRWRVLGDVEEVFDLVRRSEDLARWWPAAFLEVLELELGDENGLGKVVRLESRGWLPYRLHWHLRVDQIDRPRGFAFHVWGDFEGRGAWSFAPDGDWTDVGFDWQVRVNKPLVRYLAPLLKPLFESNHRWAMARGEESLRLELARRHASEPEQREALPPPPMPLDYPWAPPLVIAGLIAAVFLLRRRR